ncbi:MAG: transpeptidase family protein [Prevotella sp.]|nr:transpeptidase family protein [Candidatus Equicola stercoris]
MMKIFFNNKKTLKRYRLFAWLFVLLGIFIVFATLRTMTVDSERWIKLSKTLKNDSVPLPAIRGNILSSDGTILASSLPKYKIFMDFEAGDSLTRDSVWKANEEIIYAGLSEIFPDMSAADFKARLEKGRRKARGRRHVLIYPKSIDYNKYKAVRRLPVFCLSAGRGGFHVEPVNNARNHPYDRLAGRTIGDWYDGKDSAKNGLELSYDRFLRGVDGLEKKQKVRSSNINLPSVKAIDGNDIVTTIDVDMQDIAERAILEQLKRFNSNVGVAIVMECSTGDVKAIVNLSRYAEGKYAEMKNNALSDLLDPGSVFKTASLMVALDDGVCDTTEIIETGCGIVNMHGAKMKDHNWHKGGYGTMNMAKALEQSSNIGVSQVIDKYYRHDPQKFVDGLNRIGITSNLRLPIKGSAKPRIYGPRERAKMPRMVWAGTSLPWMSIGYETQIPPISTIAFYNAIANDGVMMKPRFVSKVVKDGEVIEEFPPEVLKKKICNKDALKKVQTMLTHVVSRGTGKPARSKYVKIAGKTGTAQISKGSAGYRAGGVNYLLSFAGYFPVEKPKYSCIVCIQNTGGPAAGGLIAGSVAKKIAEGVMARDIVLTANEARDSINNLHPIVKVGNKKKTEQVFAELKLKGQRYTSSDTRLAGYRKNIMPDVIGMGARDAVYALEKRGIKVKLSGRGKVTAQDISVGTIITKGMKCTLHLN